MTGLAAGLGVIGVGLGWWWADAVAAVAISLSILHDGWRNTSAVIQDLMERQPYKVDHTQPEELPERMRDALNRMDWVEAADVRLREAGHVFFGEVYIVPRAGQDLIERARQVKRELGELDWRIHDLTVDFVGSLDEEGG
jgi:divalent metal cation (Fe/Co/Zn/Cd) transporter